MTIKLRVIVAGGREFNDYQFMKRRLDAALRNYKPEEVEIISGKARGADSLGERYANEIGCLLKEMAAPWEDIEGRPKSEIGTNSHGKYWKKAGTFRNEQMAKYACSDPNIKGACTLFWDGESRGTKNMRDLAEKYNLVLKVYYY